MPRMFFAPGAMLRDRQSSMLQLQVWRTVPWSGVQSLELPCCGPVVMSYPLVPRLLGRGRDHSFTRFVACYEFDR